MIEISVSETTSPQYRVISIAIIIATIEKAILGAVQILRNPLRGRGEVTKILDKITRGKGGGYT